jgi:hypothetical protein
MDIIRAIRERDYSPVMYHIPVEGTWKGKQFGLWRRDVLVKAQPRYEHDCSRCVFLGRYREYDLYWCPQDRSPPNAWPTVIARWSSCGPDYLSGMPISPRLGMKHPLTVAMKRAKQRGLRCEKFIMAKNTPA